MLLFNVTCVGNFNMIWCIVDLLCLILLSHYLLASATSNWNNFWLSTSYNKILCCIGENWGKEKGGKTRGGNQMEGLIHILNDTI